MFNMQLIIREVVLADVRCHHSMTVSITSKPVQADASLQVLEVLHAKQHFLGVLQPDRIMLLRKILFLELASGATPTPPSPCVSLNL